MQNALRGVPGVVNAEVSFASSSATVTLSSSGSGSGGSGPRVTMAALVGAVEAMGFDASLASPPTVLLKVEGMMCQVTRTPPVPRMQTHLAGWRLVSGAVLACHSTTRPHLGTTF